MTRTVSDEVYEALQQRKLVARDFVWIIAKNRESGEPVPDGMWSDCFTINAEVIDPNTGGPTIRQFIGAGNLISISDIPIVSNLSVQNVSVVMSQVSDHVNDLIQLYNCKQADIQIFRGLFDPETREMVAPATPRFVGFIDKIEVTTPSEDNEGAVTLTCTSTTQEMTRSNPDTRSHESQTTLRLTTDDFFKDVATVGDWVFFWGRANGKVA